MSELLSEEEELRKIWRENREIISAIATFSAEDFDSLRLHTDTSSSEHQLLFEKYITYLREQVELFELGSMGRKSNLNQNNELQVLEEADYQRLLFLVRKACQGLLPQDGQVEFKWLYSMYISALHAIATDAQERGLDCFFLADYRGYGHDSHEHNFPNVQCGCFKRSSAGKKKGV